MSISDGCRSPETAKLFIDGMDIGSFVTINLNDNLETTIETICYTLLLKKSNRSNQIKLGLDYGHKLIKTDEDESCSICLEQFKKGLYKRSLECKHEFHKKCIDKWIKNGSDTCPICRTYF